MVKADLQSYENQHRHPANRALHAIGIPIVIISIPLVFLDWRYSLALHVTGWAILWLGHAIEGNLPASWKNPWIVFVAPIWWIKRMLGKTS
ncbi:MAG: Mpo1-like protein [Planctomycetota bacterium]